MNKITQKEFLALATTECIKILKCSKVRTCGWEGFPFQRIEIKNKTAEGFVCLACPKCSNDSFYEKYMPKDEAEKLYVDQCNETS